MNKTNKLLKEVLDELRAPGPFRCDRCPRNRDPQRGAWCPAWGYILLTEHKPGGTQDVLHEDCYFNRMEKWHEGIRGCFGINIDSINAARSEVERMGKEVIPVMVAVLLQDAQTRQALVEKLVDDPSLLGTQNNNGDSKQLEARSCETQ